MTLIKIGYPTYSFSLEVKMEKYFDLGRAYYTYLKSSTNKDQCTVSVICDDIKHNIMDGLLFAGAYIYDGYQENTDGSITVCDGNISVYGKRQIK